MTISMACRSWFSRKVQCPGLFADNEDEKGPLEPQKIYKMKPSWYSKFCNRWFSIFGVRITFCINLAVMIRDYMSPFQVENCRHSLLACHNHDYRPLRFPYHPTATIEQHLNELFQQQELIFWFAKDPCYITFLSYVTYICKILSQNLCLWSWFHI